MRRTTAVLVTVLAFAASTGGAAAQPLAGPPLPSTLPPAAAAVPLFTLTAIPAGWQERLDLRPQLEVFSGGKAIESPDAIAPNRAPDVPPTRVDGHIPPEVLSAALSETRALADADLGVPETADRGTRIIDYMPQAPESDVHLIVYAPESTEGLGAEQQSARKRFADLYTRLLDAFVRDH